MPERHPHVETWKQVYEQGHAGQLADALVRQRDPPRALLAAVCAPVVRVAPVRGLEILDGMVRLGLTSHEYAAHSGRSVQTIKTHLRRARMYYGCVGKPILALYAEALRAGDLLLPPSDQLDVKLTRREQEVLMATAEHGSRDMAALALEVTVHTVKFHLANAKRKLDARSSWHAHAVAVRAGLLNPLLNARSVDSSVVGRRADTTFA